MDCVKNKIGKIEVITEPTERLDEECKDSLVKGGGSEAKEFDDVIETGVLSTDEEVFSDEGDVDESQTHKIEVDETDGAQTISCRDQSPINLNLSEESNRMKQIKNDEVEILILDKEIVSLTPEKNENKQVASVDILQDDTHQGKQIDNDSPVQISVPFVLKEE